jgi:CheY-like chemotaxis protein
VIRRSSEHLSTLVDGLLDIAKIEAGRLQLNRDRVALGELLEQLVDMFRIQAGAKGIQFRYEPAANVPPYVFADEKRLRQILINLLSNAVKYTRQGGVLFRVRHRGQNSEFEVADTGIGIDAADLQRIFQPFERGKTARALGLPGTGLGLTITKLLAEIMGGEVSVESTVGEGSLFRVRLMLSEASPPVVAVRQRRIKGYQGRPMKVLAADDDLGHLDLLHELLTPLGFELETAQNGEICLQRAAANPPDLALLDLSMPDMNGWEVARRLRERRSDPIPIIIVSANADEQMQAHSFDDTSFVTKPIEVNYLLASIRDALGLEWVYEESAPQPADPVRAAKIPMQHLNDLHRLGKIGYVRGIEAKLDEIAGASAEHASAIAELRALVRNFELKQYMARLEALLERAGS